MATGTIKTNMAQSVEVTIPSTLPSNLSAIASIHAYANDSTVMVIYDMTTSASPSGSYQTVASGFPLPPENVWTSVSPWSSSETGAGFRVGLNTSGELKVANGIASTRYVGSFTYLRKQ